MRWKYVLTLLAVAVAALIIASCGKTGSQPPATSSQGSTNNVGQSPAKTSSDEQQPREELIKVSFAQSQDILSFAPLYVARAKGFFEEEGIDLTVEVLAGGTQSIQALSGDSVQFAEMSSADFLAAVAKGIEFVAVQATIMQTMDVAVNKNWLDSKGVDRNSSVEDRIRALEGAVIGSTGPGAVSETYPQWLMQKVGLDPQTSIDIIAIGGLPARQAALKSGQIHAYVASPPGPEQAEVEGFGYVLIPPSDVPGFENYLHEILFTKRQYIEENPDVVRRVVRALSRGNNYLLDNVEESKQLVKQFFPEVDDEVISKSIDNIVGQVPRNGLMAKEHWDFVLQFLRDIGTDIETVDTNEGHFWTNEFNDFR